mmetsp:Transcript_34657/g.95494  ORF Transcript_34657/g.95494 Transcript_34657/m.95494 type:complete len:516 (+) Transcript_34657:103-1650(+)
MGLMQRTSRRTSGRLPWQSGRGELTSKLPHHQFSRHRHHQPLRNHPQAQEVINGMHSDSECIPRIYSPAPGLVSELAPHTCWKTWHGSRGSPGCRRRSSAITLTSSPCRKLSRPPSMKTCDHAPRCGVSRVCSRRSLGSQSASLYFGGCRGLWRRKLCMPTSQMRARAAGIFRLRSVPRFDRYLRTARRTTLFVVLVPLLPDGGQSGAGILVGTTHLLSTVHELPTNLDVQTFQAIRTMEALSAVYEAQAAQKDAFDTVDVIFTGDLNAPPHYPASVVDALEQLIQHAAEAEDVAAAWEDADLDRPPHQHCDSWAASGECLRNPHFMLLSCLRACEAAGIGGEERRRLLCQTWAASGDCDKHASRMRARCPASCSGGPAQAKGKAAAPPWAIVRSPVYELLTEGGLSDDSIALLVLAAKASGHHPSQLLPLDMLKARWGDLAMLSAYAAATGAEPVTCLKETLDYIFFSGRRPGSRLTLRGVLSVPPALNYEESIRGLGSDHVPLVADFLLPMAP